MNRARHSKKQAMDDFGQVWMPSRE